MNTTPQLWFGITCSHFVKWAFSVLWYFIVCP